MRHRVRFAALVGAAVLSGLLTMPAAAQATRTWVSGVGDDANPCSRTAPCKTFAGAISKTAAGGEIDVLDSGGYGAVTITKSITIDGSNGSIAGVLVAGTNGVTVNDGGAGTAVVTLRNLDIEGLGLSSSAPGIRGINFVSGVILNVQNCVIRNFRDAANGTGISFTPSTAARLDVDNVLLTGNGNNAVGGGIVIKPTGTGSVVASLNRVRADQNSNVGLLVSTVGVTGGAGNLVNVVDSAFNQDGTGITSLTAAGTPVAKIMLDHVDVSNNNIGISAGGTANALVMVGNSTVTGNSTGLQVTSPAVIGTYANNRVNGNTTDVSGTLTTLTPR